jgi:hypothetical protein
MAMKTDWFIGTIRDVPAEEPDQRNTLVPTLSVQITSEEHQALRDAERVIREAVGGLLFRLVFANHRAFKDHVAGMLELLTRRDRKGLIWAPEEYLQTTLALANWLTSVRWLLDQSTARLADEPGKLERVERAMSREFDNHFAYRFTYKLRNFVTHRDLLPIAMHVSSRLITDKDREDSLSLQLDPAYLLTASKKWGGPVTKDLKERTEPIDLVPLVDDAMESIERVMTAVLVEDVPMYQDAARLIVETVDRLSDDDLEGDAAPVLFVAQTDEEGIIRHLSPTPLPFTEARDFLSSSAKAPD